MSLSEDELRNRKKEYNKKYRESQKGKEAQKRANKKYQQTQKYKEYKHKYYLNSD